MGFAMGVKLKIGGNMVYIGRKLRIGKNGFYNESRTKDMRKWGKMSVEQIIGGYGVLNGSISKDRRK